MIFSVDTPSDIKSGYSYVVNREEDKYTILEGNIELFDRIAFDNIARGVTKTPYDRVVLSFKEEDLTLDEITEIYYDWKELYLGSYDEDEYCLFSVIHWDDDHPHIHVGIINNSLINDKKLRMVRYGIDNKINARKDAIQEVINYKYGLKSPMSEKMIFQTTREQKERDWKVKKEADYYEVEDDRFHTLFKSLIRESKDYSHFWELLSLNCEGVIHKGIFENEGLIKIGNKRFRSLIFNEMFFNENLEALKQGQVEFKVGMPDESYYQGVYEKKNTEHKEHLFKRNIKEGLLEHKLQKGELEFLSNTIAVDGIFKDIQDIKSLNPRFKKNQVFIQNKFLRSVSGFVFCKEDLELYLDSIGYKLKDSGFSENLDGYIVIEKDGYEIRIDSNEIYEASQTSKMDMRYFEKINVQSKNKLKHMIESLSLKKRDNIEIIKATMSSYIIEYGIDDVKKFELLCDEIGLKVVNQGYSVMRGGYVTLEAKGKKFALYDDLVYSFYGDEILINDTSLDNNGLKSMIMDEQGLIKPESVYEYKLDKKEDIDFVVTSQDSNDLNFDKISKRDRKSKTKIDNHTDAILLRRTLDEEDAISQVVGVIHQKGWKNFKIAGSSTFYQESIFRNLSYLSADNEQSNDWISQLRISSDLYDNPVSIRNGEIYEVGGDSARDSKGKEVKETVVHTEEIVKTEEKVSTSVKTTRNIK